MTPKQVNRLYDGLTPNEQANLAFAAIARQDTGEAKTILNHVERVNYLTVHTDYKRRIWCLQLLASVYGLEYWKVRALMLYALESDVAEDVTKGFLQKLLALEVALVNVCDRLNVDITAIKAMVQCLDIDEAKKPLPTAAANAELVAQYDEMLAAVFSEQ